MENLPKQIRFNTVRPHGKSMLDWTIDEVIFALNVELDVQECHIPLLNILNGNNQE